MVTEDCISARKGTTKHCCWGACNSDSRYLEDSNGIFFIGFPMSRKLKDSMTDWEKNRIKQDTKKCKRWVHCCERKNFTINDIKKDTYICPTEGNPDPLLATSTKSEIAKATKKRKPPTVRDFSAPVEKKKRKQKRTKNVACNSESPKIYKNDNKTLNLSMLMIISPPAPIMTTIIIMF